MKAGDENCCLWLDIMTLDLIITLQKRISIIASAVLLELLISQLLEEVEIAVLGHSGVFLRLFE